VRAGPETHEGLGDEHEVVAAAGQRFAQDLLRAAERIHVGRVDRRDAGLAAHIEDARGVGDAEIAHLAEPIPAADRHRAEAEHRQTQPGCSQLPLFHDAASA
jgi:hypothetical protein